MAALLRIPAALICLLAASCVAGAHTGPQPAARRPAVTVGLALSNLHNPFFTTVEQGAQTAAKRVGARLVVRDAHDDGALQRTQIDELARVHVDVLVVNPVAEDVAPAVQHAVAAKVPVITVDRSLRGVPVISYISSDNVAGGRTAAVYLAASVGGSGDVIEITGSETTSADNERGIGFRQALVGYPGIRIIERLKAGFDRATARRVFAAALARHSHLDGVFAHNDQMVLGALDALQAAHRTDHVVLVGFDGIEQAVDDVDRGLIAATVAQQPAEMGRLSVETAIAHLAGRHGARIDHRRPGPGDTMRASWPKRPPRSVGWRIALGFLGMAVIALILSGIGLWYSSSVAVAVESARTGIAQLHDADELERHLFAVEATVDQGLLTRQDSLISTRLGQSLQDFRAELDRVVAANRPNRFAAQERLRELPSLGEDLADVVGRVALATRDNRWALAEVLRHTEMSSLQQRFQTALDQLRSSIESEVVSASAQASRGENALRWYWTTTAAVLLTGGAVVGYVTTRRITRPVNALVAQTRRVTDGDFSPVVASLQLDEIGLLSRSFAAMTDRLRTTYDALGQHVRELQSARDSLSRSTGRLESVVALYRAILALESPPDIAREALIRLRELVPARYSSVWLAQEPGQERMVLAVEGAASGDVLDADGLPLWLRARIVEPLVVRGEVTGALVLAATDPNAFTDEHADIAREFAAEVALAVQQARLVEELQRYASELEIRIDEVWQSEERFRNLVEAAPDAIVSVDRQEKVVLANSRAERLFGYPRAELVGTPLRALVPDWCQGPDDGWEDQPAGPPGTSSAMPLEHVARSYDGGTFPVEITVGRVEAAGSMLTTSIIRDITERKRFEEQLVYLADHDSLTGLMNKRRFEHELDAHLRRLSRSNQPAGAVLFLDLDNLKYVNDSLGHSVGDELIRSVSSVLHTRLRSSDVMSRLGGDEFAILLTDARQAEATLVAEELLAAVRLHHLADEGKRIQTTISIGIAIIEETSVTVGDLLIAADLAMYEAKDSGRDRAVTFVPARHHGAAAPLARSAQIRQALERDEFSLFCQPILDLRSDQVTRYEALVRMASPEGWIEPDAFLPAAERFGLITSIDRWVVHRSIELVAAMDTIGREVTALEVNLSGRSVTDHEFFSFVSAEIAHADIDPSRLIFEITETEVIANMSEAVKFAKDLTRLGCQFALDDFGAGFASFYYLKHLPLSYLKLDGDFIRALPSSESDQVMVQAMVQVARGLGLQTIAEFVGDAETVGLLKQYGVDYAQGYYIGRPQSAGDVFLTETGAGS